jgi:hypothetical protein
LKDGIGRPLGKLLAVGISVAKRLLSAGRFPL